MGDALFRPSGGDFVPSELSRGPWSAEALHGGPVAALLCGLAEALPRPGPMHPARLTVELLRPVPLAPLRGEARLLRPGRKVQLAQSALFAGEHELARATLLWIRAAELPLPESHGGGRSRPPQGPASVAPTPAVWTTGAPAYHSHAVEHRVVRGSWFGRWRFINPDLTIHLQRLPGGEWVCLDAVTWLEGEGSGLAESELFDERGRLGRSLQSLLLERS
jgi:hypothetical protein